MRIPYTVRWRFAVLVAMVSSLLAVKSVHAGIPDTDAAATVPAVTFPIREFRVLGNSVLPARDIEAAVYPFLGEQRSMQHVERAREALAEVYKQQGYGTVLVDIPEQSVDDDAIVRLSVTEGRVGRLRVTGAKYTSAREVRDALTAAQPGTVPFLPKLQEQLTDLGRRNADRQIVPVLRAGKTPGTLDVDLKVTDRVPVHASLSVNNRYSADTSELRAAAEVSYGNLFQRGHSLSLQYQTSPEDTSEVGVLAATYVGRVSDSQDAWALYAIDSKSNVAAVGTLAVIGNGRIYGARYIHSIAAPSNFSRSLTFGVDYKDFLEDVRLPESDEPAKTPISYLVWSATFATAARQETLEWAASGGLKWGLRGLGNSPQEFAFRRVDARANFMAANGSLSGRWRPPVSGFLNGSSLVGRLAFQVAPQPLVSNEQFGLGGVDSVRGYLEAEALVDSGLTLNAEFEAPPWSFNWSTFTTSLTGLIFADAGIGKIERPLPSVNEALAQTSRFAEYSVGAGLKLLTTKVGEAHLYWALPLRDGERTSSGDARWLFTVQTSF